MKCLATIRPQLKIVFALLALTSVAYSQEIAKLDRFVQSTKGNTASMQIFREGRDLIEAQNWQKAADKFNEFIAGYPKDKDLDAALYWFGYALQKQGRKDDAKAPLIRLINRFPNSTWRREAEALLVVLGVALVSNLKNGRFPALGAVGYYWHFVDVVWVLVFSIVYLWPLIR